MGENNRASRHNGRLHCYLATWRIYPYIAYDALIVQGDSAKFSSVSTRIRIEISGTIWKLVQNSGFGETKSNRQGRNPHPSRPRVLWSYVDNIIESLFRRKTKQGNEQLFFDVLNINSIFLFIIELEINVSSIWNEGLRKCYWDYANAKNNDWPWVMSSTHS